MNRKQRRADKKQRLAPAVREEVGVDKDAGRAMPRVVLPGVQVRFADALRHHQAGRLNEAERLYREILQGDPRHADSMHLLGVIAHQVGRNDLAEEWIGEAIAIDGTVAAYHSNLGIARYGLGHLAAAIESYRAALRIKPDYAEAYSNLGNALKDLGRFDDAIASYGAALRIKPDYAEVHFNLGNALKDLGRLEGAIASYRAALRVKPDYAEACSNQGNALKELGCLDAAVAAYGTAVRIKPDYAEAHYNRGIALYALGRFDDAVASYATALEIKPGYAEAHSNRGIVLTDIGRIDDAIISYAAALCLKPDYPEAHYNQANALYALGRFDDAKTSYRTALRIKPDYAEAHTHHGNVLKDLGRLDDAVDAYRAALCIKPDSPEVYYNLGAVQDDIDAAVASHRAALRISPEFSKAHSSLLMGLHYLPGIEEETILRTAQHFAAQFEKPRERSFSCLADPDRRLRIGYVSGDFRRHPVGYFLSGVLNNHDPMAVEVFCYSNSPQVDDLTARLQGAANHWRSLVGLSDQAAAALVAADGIDILVDLSGHTALNRLPMFALKPAPIQVTWLGYFGTTGLQSMDYILADRFVAPGASASEFTETLWHLPDSYLCFCPPDFACPVVTPPATRGEPLTFGSFNNHAKTSPTTIALWSRILERVPNSRLFLKTKALADAMARQRLLNQFAERGVEAERLLLEGDAPRVELLSSYNRVDIALDPTPYGGGTTTAEALWMGVPVVTLRGKTWVGRVSESILAAVGLAEFVADSPDAYVEIAVGMAMDRPRLARYRSALRAQVEESPFCDGVRFTRHLEEAYRGMWQTWCAGQGASGLDIPPSSVPGLVLR